MRCPEGWRDGGGWYVVYGPDELGIAVGWVNGGGDEGICNIGRLSGSKVDVFLSRNPRL